MLQTFKLLHVVNSEIAHQLVSITIIPLCHRTPEVILLVSPHLILLLAFADLYPPHYAYEINLLSLHT